MNTDFVNRTEWRARAMKSLGVLMLGAALGGCGSSDDFVPPPAPAPAPSAQLPTCTAAVSAAAPLTDITTIQGTGSTSALVSQTVTVRGVVAGEFQSSAGDRLGGFFVQQAVPDADPLTSEGLFVFAPSAPKVLAGDYVQVEGVVAEFGGAADSVTQLSGAVTVSICGSGVSLSPTAVTLPLATDTFPERLEGMLVRFEQPLAVTEFFELGRFGQMVLSLNTRQFNFTNGNGSATSVQNRLERIVLDDGSSAQNPNPIPYLSEPGIAGTRRIGDTVTGLTGVLSHNFGAYRVHPVSTPTFAITNPRPAAAPAVAGTLKVASFNVLNYFTTLGSRGANTAAEFTRQKTKIVEAIAGIDADVLGLIEIENNGDTATLDLVAALNTKMGAGTYAAINSGTFGTDEIKVDIIYKPARVKPIGGTVLPTGADLALYTAVSGRPPLAQRFASAANAGGFWFVVNHFKSKSVSSCPASGDVDLGQGCWNLARTDQATALNNFAATLKAQGENDVLIMGDINSYLLEDPPKALEAAGNESLLKRMPANDRFTYVFGGETGALDHAYASDTLKAQVSGVGVWHINADEPPVIDYNTEFKTDDRYAPTAYRASDHDPVIVGLSLSPDATLSLPILSADIPSAAQAQAVYSVGVNASASEGATITTLNVDWGDGSAPTAAASAVGSVTHTYTATGTYTVVVTLTDSSGQTATRSNVVSVSLAPLTTPDLIFSEYIEGSSNNKAIEIYNAGTATVDLSAYTVKLFPNGATTAGNVQTLSGTLSAGGIIVLVNNLASPTFKIAGSITSTVANFNGDDALTLEKSGAVIDRIGQLGADPGTAWVGGAVSTLNQTLRRKAGITIGENAAPTAFDPSLQWDAFPMDAADGLGTR
jgi:uncharacterized protein